MVKEKVLFPKYLNVIFGLLTNSISFYINPHSSQTDRAFRIAIESCSLESL